MPTITIANTAKPRAANGLADLLLALALADHDARREEALAAVLGFTVKPDSVPEKPQPQLSVASDTPNPEPQPTHPNTKATAFHPYHLVALETVTPQQDGQNQHEDTRSTGMLSAADTAPWDAHLPIPSYTPIVPWSRLWPRLRLAVACHHPAGMDLARLTQCLASGQVVCRLPRRTRLTWPNPLVVVFDFSDRLTAYWDDWHWLRQHLETRLHQQVRCYRLKGVPQNPLQLMVNGRPKPEFSAWPELAAGDSLLLASDLGLVDPAHAWPRQCWQEQLANYQRLGVKVTVLAPVSNRHLQAGLVNLATTVRLSPDSDLRPLARLTDNANPAASNTTAHPAVPTLLAMMSVATRIEPALLRTLRRHLANGGLDAGLEGEAWCHQELDTAATACAIAPWAVQAWRGKFATLPIALQQNTLDCLRVAHARLPQAIHHEETLLWQALADAHITADEHANSQRARGFFEKLANTLAQADAPSTPAVLALQVQLADRHVHWVASTLSTESYVYALSNAIAQLEPKRLAIGLPTALDPLAWLTALPPVSEQTLSLLQLPLASPALAISESLSGNGISPIASLTLDRPAVLWAWQNANPALAYTPWYWQNNDSHLPLPALLSDPTPSPTLVLHTRHQRLQLQRYQPSAWVEVWGQDRYGLYADLKLQGITQRFRWIPPGVFMMGSPESEPQRYDVESQHEVTLRQGFWLADTASTQALWLAVMGENPSEFKDDLNNPVDSVNWNDCQQFIKQLNGIIPDLAARLPTEAEWEYACRAGTTTPFSFGENITPEQVNYDGNKGKYRQKTVAVKSLPANAWGLYEMHGNVWEWCEDWFGGYPKVSVWDPTGPTAGAARVLRGGSWLGRAEGTRSAYRDSRGPGSRYNFFGFRLALGRSGASSQPSR